MRNEEKALLQSFFIPAVALAVMYLVKLTEWLFHVQFSAFGIHPLHLDGLPGIVLSPFIHGDWQHLAANSIPLLVLGAALYFFYRPIASKILLMIILITGIWVWAGARGGYHIGASSLIYGLSSFLLVSGFIRRETKLMALSLVVVFLYGSLVWGIFPEFFPKKNISWEGHLSGMIAGLVLAVFYKNEGPQRKPFTWEEPEHNDEDTDNSIDDSSEKPYWDVPEPDQKDLTVVYHPGRKS